MIGEVATCSPQHPAAFNIDALWMTLNWIPFWIARVTRSVWVVALQKQWCRIWMNVMLVRYDILKSGFMWLKNKRNGTVIYNIKIRLWNRNEKVTLFISRNCMFRIYRSKRFTIFHWYRKITAFIRCQMVDKNEKCLLDHSFWMENQRISLIAQSFS